MIANKVLPAFYLLEIEGEACRAIIPDAYGIVRITIGSRDFRSDVDATIAADKMMQYLRAQCVVASEETHLNPEFFPTAPELDIPQEQLQQIDDAQAMISSESFTTPANTMAAVITRNFDTLGDYVTRRTVLKNASFTITEKIVANPGVYLTEKTKEAYRKNAAMLEAHRELPNDRTSIH